MEKEHGVELLQNLVRDHRPYTEIKHLARQLLLQVQGHSTTNFDVCMDVSFDDDVGTSVDLGVGAVCENMEDECGNGDGMQVGLSHEADCDRANQNHVEQGMCHGRGDNLDGRGDNLDGREDNMDNKVVFLEASDEEEDFEDFL